MSNQLGEYLRGLREAKGLTTRQLSSTVGCSQPFITMVETGERSPTLHRLWEIIKALDGDFKRALFLLCLDSDIPREVVQDIIAGEK